MKLNSLTKSAINAVKRQLSSKFKKAKVAKGDISHGFLNLYDKAGSFITSVAQPAGKLFESVEPIDNRLDNVRTKDNYFRGRPEMRDYTISKSVNNKLTINPSGVIGWYSVPYTGPGDLQRFLKNADITGNAMDLSSELMRKGKIVVRIPSNRDKYLKDIYSKGISSNPYGPKAKNALKESVIPEGFI
jgi:hypothetical protein